MENLVELIPQIGFYGVCLVAGALFLKSLITKMMENNDKMMEQNYKREDKLQNLIENNTKALTEITTQLNKNNEVSEKLVDTNKSLVEEIKTQINNIDRNVEKLLDK